MAFLVVFDGYSSGPTIKDVAHERRSKGLKGNQTIFDRNTPFKSKKESFLSNIVNKQNFINLLSEYLEAIVCQVLHAQNDADHLIVDTAVVAAAESGSPIVIIGEDTDLLVLLCSNDTASVKHMYIMSYCKSGKKRTFGKLITLEQFSVKKFANACLLFMPFLDVTQHHIYTELEKVLLKKCIKDENIRQLASTFLKPEVTHDTV